MLYINKITNVASQQLILTGIPGIQITLALRFLPRVQQWIMDVSYGSFMLTGITVNCSLNILRQWQNVIPFGISCLSPSGLDPYQLGDFSDQNALLYLLDSNDVQAVEAEWFE